LQCIPKLTAPVYIALATVICCGVFLGYVAGGMYGEHPRKTVPGLVEEAYRYNATQRPSEIEVVLFGNSLTMYGLREDELRERCGKHDVKCVTLVAHGAGMNEYLRLLKQMKPSRATVRSVAVLQVHRKGFSTTTKRKWSMGWREYFWGKLASWKPTAKLIRDVDDLMQWVPQRRELNGDDGWLMQISYGWAGYYLGGLIDAPTPKARALWSLDDVTRKRMSANMMPVEYAQDFWDGQFNDGAVSEVRAVVAAFQARGYQVVLYLPPFCNEFFATLNKNAAARSVEEQFRSTLLNRSSTGADAVIEFRDPAAFGADDSYFYDYGHLKPGGATLLTRHFADALVRTAVLD